MTIPPTRVAIGVTCASTCASSVVSRPAVAQSQTPVTTMAISTMPIPMRILLFMNWLRSLLRISGRPQNALHGGFGIAERSCEDRLGDVVAKQRVDVLFLGSRHRLLRLHHFNVVGDAGGKAIPRLRQFLVGELARTRGDLRLLASSLQIEKRRAHVVVDLRAHVVRLGTTLAQVGFGFGD